MVGLPRSCTIRDFPDHATFRKKSVLLAQSNKLGGFLSLTLCKKANFDLILLVKYDVFQKGLNMNKNLWNVFFSLM